jgi:hypothetical protein
MEEGEGGLLDGCRRLVRLEIVDGPDHRELLLAGLVDESLERADTGALPELEPTLRLPCPFRPVQMDNVDALAHQFVGIERQAWQVLDAAR